MFEAEQAAMMNDGPSSIDPAYYVTPPPGQAEESQMKDFDQNWVHSSDSGLQALTQQGSRTLEHTFFGHDDDTGLSMLVSEQQ